MSGGEGYPDVSVMTGAGLVVVVATGGGTDRFGGAGNESRNTCERGVEGPEGVITPVRGGWVVAGTRYVLENSYDAMKDRTRTDSIN